MAMFEVGDKVRMTGVPVVVEVLGLGVCEDPGGCELQTIRFKDPQTGELGEIHASEFLKVEPVEGRHPFEDLVLNEEDKALLYTDGVRPV